MRALFLKNISFILIVNLLIKPIWIFFIDREVQNILGHAVYGQYATFLNLSLIMLIFLDMGLNNYNSQLVSKNAKTIQTHFSSFLLLKGLLSILYLLATFLIAFLLQIDVQIWGLLLCVLLIQILNSFVQYVRTCIGGLQMFKAESIVGVFDKLCLILILSPIIYIVTLQEKLNIYLFVGAQIISYALALLLGLYLVYNKGKIAPKWRIETSTLVSIIKESKWYALVIFFMAVYIRVDLVIIERLFNNGDTKAGYYVAAYRFLDVLNMLGLILSAMLLPWFGKLMEQKSSIVPIVRFIVNLTLPMTITLAVVSVCFGQEIMGYFYDDVLPISGQLFGILMCSFPAYTMIYIYSSIINASGKMLPYVKLTFIAVVLAVVGMLIGAQSENIIWIGSVSTLVEYFVAIGCIVISYRMLKAKMNLNWLLRIGLFTLLMATTGWLITKQFLLVEWWWQLVVMLVMALIYYVSMGFISVKEGFKLLSAKIK